MLHYAKTNQMYKKHWNISFFPYRRTNTLLLAKFTLLLLFTFNMQSFASHAQKITLSERGTELNDVLKKIKKQTGYDFIINSNLLKQASPVTIDVTDKNLREVLVSIFEKQPFNYEIMKQWVVITGKESQKTNGSNKTLQSQISGRIVDEDSGKALKGASIKIKGSNVATTTDEDGKFVLLTKHNSAIVQVSFIGYVTKETKIVDGITISLIPEINTLDETVVIGYGSANRRDLTGSVSSVDVDEIRNVPFATVDQALTGKAAGVQVTQADGSPGGVAKIRIRGGTSLLGGNDPLYIIDGVQMTIQNRYQSAAADMVSPTDRGGSDANINSVEGSFARGLNSLGGLNFNDIESIDILKDASATAIYGSRAANGVVIITTKKGRNNQKPIFDANYFTSLGRPIKEKLLDASQYRMIMEEAARNLNNARSEIGLGPDERASLILSDPDFLGTANTDWLKLVLRTGVTQNADISVRGGGTGSRFYTSLGYNKNGGVVKGTDFTRIAGKVNLENDISSRFRVNTSINYGFTANNITNGLYTQALFAPPTFNPYNPDGTIRVISPEDLGADAYQGFQNPLFLLQAVNKSTNAQLIGSLVGEFDIRKDLKLRSSVAVNYNSYRQNNYVPSTVSIATAEGTGNSNNGMATQAESQDVNTFYENTLTWDKHFNESNRLNVLVGTSWQITKRNQFSARGQGFPDDKYLNNLSSAAVTLPSEGRSNQNSLLSFFLRANYTLMDKYMFTFTGRSDESSKFPKGNRVGYFPSGGVAWRISEENFLKDITWLDELKLRGSMGYTGTQNIGDNLFYTLYAPVSYGSRNGLAPSQLGNDDIRWESTLQKDAGINFAMFDGRLSGEFGFYEKSTSGVLFPTSVALSSGFGEVTANIANIRNRGLELAISGDFIRKDHFQWSGMFNISGNRSRVLALSAQVTDPNSPELYRFGNTVLKVGEPLGMLYGYVFDGILRTQEEVDIYKTQNAFYKAGSMRFLGIGDPRYVLNEDGFPKEDVTGSAEPTLYGGYTNNITYRNFGLSFLTTFQKGGDILYLYDVQNQSARTATNKGVRILDRWTPDNPNADRPRLMWGERSYTQQASNNVFDASYIRLKSITFSYQFSNDLLKKWKINNAMAYLSATNLFTITKYPGADPEVSNDPYSLIGGYSDSAGYPTIRQFSLGIRLGF